MSKKSALQFFHLSDNADKSCDFRRLGNEPWGYLILLNRGVVLLRIR